MDNEVFFPSVAHCFFNSEPTIITKAPTPNRETQTKTGIFMYSIILF